MSQVIRLKRGYDIKLVGHAHKIIQDAPQANTYAIKPPDFHGVVPKMLVQEGDEVQAGSKLFFNKNDDKVFFTSPVSGEVAEIRRGAKRRIMEVKVLADTQMRYKDFGTANPEDLTRDQIIEKLLESGLWPLVRQRPYAKIADPLDFPKAIIVPAFDSAPLAPDFNFIMKDKGQEFQAGLNVLLQLTKGKVHVNVHGDQENISAFTEAKGVQVNTFYGPHPSGTPGVQIHHLEPVTKDAVVWYLYPQDVVMMGRLFQEGQVHMERTVALTGSEMKKRDYRRMIVGAELKSVLENNVTEGERLRVISGNVLTGSKVDLDGYVGFYDSQITVIPEGDEPEFLGWLIPSYPRPTMSRTFPWGWMKDKKYKVNTNLHGEERPFVMTGKYEKVLPMDILPLQLLKACLTEDLDAMEGLGIFEVAPEDFALVEFVDTSKMPVQSIIRKGLDLMEKEG